MIKSNVVDHETIKDFNKKKILNLLQAKRELTKQDISRETGISIPTVTNNINELVSEGLVEEVGVSDSTGGRRPMLFRFLPNSRYSFGVDISLDVVRVILANLDLEILYDYRMNMKQFENLDDIVIKIRDVIKIVLSEKNISSNDILGIGLSLPGTVNEKNMMLEMAPNLGVKNICFEKYSEYFPFPMYIENEANAAALAELTLGIAKQMRNLVYISVTQGIGAGIVIQNYLYKGKNKRAGEFGHMTVEVGGRQCRCGKNGCWEMYASDRALIEFYNHQAEEKISGLEEFLQLLKEEDTVAFKVWDEYLEYLAVGIQNIILTLDPHYVVIGGEISRFGELLLNPLEEKVFIRNSFYSRKDIKIYLSKFGEDSAILGAALLPLQKLFYIHENVI